MARRDQGLAFGGALFGRPGRYDLRVAGGDGASEERRGEKPVRVGKAELAERPRPGEEPRFGRLVEGVDPAMKRLDREIAERGLVFPQRDVADAVVLPRDAADRRDPFEQDEADEVAAGGQGRRDQVRREPLDLGVNDRVVKDRLDLRRVGGPGPSERGRRRAGERREGVRCRGYPPDEGQLSLLDHASLLSVRT